MSPHIAPTTQLDADRVRLLQRSWRLAILTVALVLVVPLVREGREALAAEHVDDCC